MAIHDPESAAQEKALALKIGRQKKIQIIDGQQVEVMPGESDEEDEDEDEDEEDDEDHNMMAVEGQDGQQYVVLEVIQLQDGDEGEGPTAVAVVQDDAALAQEAAEAAIAQQEADDEERLHTMKTRRLSRRDALAIKKKLETQKDMQNCFGFDDEEDEDMEEETDVGDVDAKNAIKLLESINE